jgi:hypothetical protein
MNQFKSPYSANVFVTILSSLDVQEDNKCLKGGAKGVDEA